MTSPRPLPPVGLVKNADAVRALFGQFDLYDAELCAARLSVARGGVPMLDMDFTVAGTSALPDGTADRGRDYVITIRCVDVTDLALADFSHQNVVTDYTFGPLGDDTADERRVRVAITGAPGCDVELRCLSVAVTSVVPSRSSPGA